MRIGTVRLANSIEATVQADFGTFNCRVAPQNLAPLEITKTAEKAMAKDHIEGAKACRPQACPECKGKGFVEMLTSRTPCSMCAVVAAEGLDPQLEARRMAGAMPERYPTSIRDLSMAQLHSLPRLSVEEELEKFVQPVFRPSRSLP